MFARFARWMAGKEEPRLNIIERRIRNLENSIIMESCRGAQVSRKVPEAGYPEDMKAPRNGPFFYLEYICPVCGNESRRGWFHRKTYRLRDSGIYHLGIRCSRCGNEMDVKLVAR